MKENNDVLKYSLKGVISEKDEEHGIVTVTKGKNTDDINISDFIQDAQDWFAYCVEGEEIDFTLVAKKIKK